MTFVSSLHSTTKPIPDPHQDHFSKTLLGFWTYLMTDCILFATLFVTYGILHHSTFGGPSPRDLFDLSGAFIETMLLLFSSFACGLGLLAAKRNHKSQLIGWFILSFILGLAFVILELREFAEFVHAGHDWQQSAFLSSFFTLVGTHGLHVSIGLLWMSVLFVQLFRRGITIETFRRLVCFNLFWHFLDLVWIFIFSYVYLIGVIE